ncbi:MAG TPA: hypothetical protein DGG95_15545 [Cytophagales bacterium]|jgi:hypothetical protein|nr:hypothetical protein [Cytophagales bacterium]
MIEDDVEAMMTKTREYYNFIKRMIERESIVLKQDDLDILVNIDSYFSIQSDETWNSLQEKSMIYKNILSTCIAYLQRLDRITKEYKIFRNGE